MDDHSDNFAIVFAAMGVSILSMLYTLIKDICHWYNYLNN